jgi:hypothetical protein
METDGATELEEVPSEHMAAELGPDISTAVYVSPAPPPHLLTMIDMATTNPISARDNVIRRLDDERSMVNAIGDEVARILDEVKSFECAYPVFTFHELTTYHHRFGELRAQCTALAERRQSAFHSNIAGQNSYFEWTEYLYAECQATHPILAAITEVTEGIDELRKTLSRDIATV